MERAKIKLIYHQLDELYQSSEKISCNGESRFVIFSDLHMGDGSAKDDFKQNSELFKYSIEEYYLKNNYTLILNGDVEELQRFSLNKIRKQWNDIYNIFDKFNRKNMLYKIIENHDISLFLPHNPAYDFNIHHSITLASNWRDMLIFHGHQASMRYKRINNLVRYTLKYLANPLRIKNYSVAHDSKKQYAIERKVYHHAS